MPTQKQLTEANTLKLKANFVLSTGNQPKQFTFKDKKPGGIHEGGIYTDENQESWLLKLIPPCDAVREVFASQLYHTLTRGTGSPEVQLAQISQHTDPPKWMVASKYQEDLKPFDPRVDGIESTLISAFILHDVDCVEKNIACHDGKIFRFDFGSALRIQKDQQQLLSEITSVYQMILECGSWIKPEWINVEKMMYLLNNLALPYSNAEHWIKIYATALQAQKDQGTLLDQEDLEGEDLATQFQYVMERVQYCATLPEIKTDDSPIESSVLFDSLFQFYEAIATHVKPIISNYAVVMANRHLLYYKQHKTHPTFYTSLVETACREIDMAVAQKRLFSHIKSISVAQDNPFYLLVKEKSEHINSAYEREALLLQQSRALLNNYVTGGATFGAMFRVFGRQYKAEISTIIQRIDGTARSSSITDMSTLILELQRIRSTKPEQAFADCLKSITSLTAPQNIAKPASAL